MKRYTTITALVEAYTEDFNSRCSHSDKHFTTEEVTRLHLTTMHRHALLIKHGIEIAAKQTNVIRNFGYVAA